MIDWGKARKKPVIVQYREPMPNMKAHRREFDGQIIEMFSESNQDLPVEKIGTLEGFHYAVPGEDWVIQGIRGELYPIKKAIFDKTYDVLEPPSIDSDSVRPCPKCSGSGQVEDTGNHLAFTKTCELCDGAGKIPTNSDKSEVRP